MSERTLEELRKEINGKQVVWVWRECEDAPMDVIFLAPPKGDVVSVKPYGYKPEEVKKILDKHGVRSTTIEQLSKPEFCLETCSISEGKRKRLEDLASMPLGGVYDFSIFRGGNSNPVCPY